MTETADRPAVTRGYWIVSGVALAWNLLGAVTYLLTVTMSPEALAALPEAQRALYRDVPAWVTSAYAIAVWGGTAACVALLLRKAWAVPLFVVSLIGIVVQMGHAFLATPMLEVMGKTSAILPLVVTAVAVYLLWFARSAKARGLLR